MCIPPCLNCVNISAVYFTKSEFALCQCTIFKNILLTKFLKQKIISRKEYIICNVHLIEWILVVYCRIKNYFKTQQVKTTNTYPLIANKSQESGRLSRCLWRKALRRLQTSCWLGCSYEKSQPVGRGSTFKLILLVVSSLGLLYHRPVHRAASHQGR